MRLRKVEYHHQPSMTTKLKNSINNKYTRLTSLIALCGFTLYCTVPNFWLNKYATPQQQTQRIQQIHQKAPKEGDVFEPGSLADHNRIETFRKCYVDPLRYGHHFPIPKAIRKKCTTSETHKIVYTMIGKSGSSSAKITMRDKFNANNGTTNCQLHIDDPEYHTFTFVRDPFSRFISSFRQELLIRYLSHHHSKGRHKKRRNYPHKDHSKTVRALETYVDSYNGTGAPLNHLRMQVPQLMHGSPSSGWRLPNFDAIYEVTNMEEEFKKLFYSRSSNSTYHDDIISKISSTSDTANGAVTSDALASTIVKLSNEKHLRIDTSAIAIRTRKKICQLSALDFCCLNYKVPPECRGLVKCRWTQRPSTSDSLPLVIEAISPYPPSTNSYGHKMENETHKHWKKRSDEHVSKMDAAIHTMK